MEPSTILIMIFAIFAIGIISVFYLKKQKTILSIPAYSAIIVAMLSSIWAWQLYKHGHFLFCKGNIVIDALSIFHIALVNIVFVATSLYMTDYFPEIESNDAQSIYYYKRFSILWQAFHAMLLLVLISNNIGLTWIALETTTIVSSFLILTDSNTLSIEAMWKYLLVCSIGIALAFIGTILVVSAANSLPSADSLYTFSELQSHASQLNPSLMLFAFIFIVVGFGTKAGLAPMHTWLPDAHSQAPTPVSAVFSGVMLNCALFVIMRYLPIVDVVGGSAGHAHEILLFLGFLSLLIAVIFIPIQYDIKRFLAYCSVEHIGIIAIGLGLGGFGTVVALFHILNHSLSKMLAFFSAGSIINQYKTRDIRKISGVIKTMPLWGTSLLVSMFVLIGIAPSSMFLSEFMLAKTAFSTKHYVVLALFLFGVFAIFISALKLVLNVVYGKHQKKNEDLQDIVNKKTSVWNKIIIVLCFAEFIVLGLYMPEPLLNFLKSAAAIIEHGITL